MEKSYYWQKGVERYYKVFVYKDLLGHWVLTKAWGGLQNRLGNYEHLTLFTKEAIRDCLAEIFERRDKRGYKLII